MADPEKKKKNTNEAILALLIVHQILLLRFGSTLANILIVQLNDTEQNVASAIRDPVTGVPIGLNTPAQWQQFQILATRIKQIRQSAWVKAQAQATDQLNQLSVIEAGFDQKLYTDQVPVIYNFALPSIVTLNGIVANRPFNGLTLAQWFTNMAADDSKRIVTAIQAGASAAKPAADIARDVVGTAANQGSDGVTELARKNVQSIVRTATNHVAAQSRKDFYGANDNVFELTELFQAVLDSHTTPLCRGLDGNVYPVGEGPQPPLHIGCRSMRIPALNTKELSKYPVKPGQNLDQFYGDLTPIDSYASWLADQPPTVQDDVLGKSRGAQYRKGMFKITQFQDLGYRPITLNDLANP